jgi:hypothetical protein
MAQRAAYLTAQFRCRKAQISCRTAVAPQGRSKSRSAGSGSSSEQWAWSAGTVWRGDLRLLAHIARVTREVAAVEGSDGSLRIKLTARGDWEEFSTPEEFLQRVTQQAVRSFKLLTISAQAERRGAEVLIARKRIYEPPFNGTWGVVVQAHAGGGRGSAKLEEAKAMCDRLRIVLRRGSLPWTLGLRATETAPRNTIEHKLQTLGSFRANMTKGFVTMSASMPFWLSALLLPDGRDTEGDRLPYLTAVQLLIIFWGPLLASRILPAIEINELSPARRMLRLVGRSGILSATAAGLVVTFVQVRAGLSP